MKREKERITFKKVLHAMVNILMVILLAAGILFIFRNLVNKIFLMNYRNENYSNFPENMLLPIELGENYVPYYNVGNAEYQKGNYEEAARYYYTALQKEPPEEEKECAVRVNFALAYLHTYPFETMDMENQEEIEAALNVLYGARQVLTEHGCACEDFGKYTGHSEEAEKLKRDIDEMIMKLSASQSRSGDGSDSQDSSGGDGEDESQKPDQEGDSKQDTSNTQEGSEEEEQQKSLQQELKEQKQDLEEGNYSSGRSSDFTYVEGDGEMTGYGEGAPW